MTKRKEAQPDVVAVADSAKGTAKTITITNNQRRTWFVPKDLMGSVLCTTESIVRPGCSVEISKEKFDTHRKYIEGSQKGSKAFASMLDLGLLVASGKRAKLDMRDLKDAQPCKAPPELMGDGKVKNVTMSQTPVTITLEKTAAAK